MTQLIDTDIDDAVLDLPIHMAGRNKVPQLGKQWTCKKPWRGMSLIKCCGRTVKVFKQTHGAA